MKVILPRFGNDSSFKLITDSGEELQDKLQIKKITIFCEANETTQIALECYGDHETVIDALGADVSVTMVNGQRAMGDPSRQS